VQRFHPDPPTCFISPHLDDVALSCSHWLAANPAASVVTVFAGAPSIERADGWNYDTTGETSAQRAIHTRRSEDLDAMAALHASAYWIELWDSQYVAGEGRDLEVVRTSIGELLARVQPRSVVAPLGIHHPDHVAVADACFELAATSERSWYGYLDMPYGQTYPDLVEPRLAAARARADLDLVEREPVQPTTDVKDRVVRLYRSQRHRVRADHPGFEESLTDPERFWALARPDQAAPTASSRAQR
jgi:LmbE family N-acetylglucosaminyl deacetylase